MYPSPLGVTDRIRPAPRHRTLDEGASIYLAGAFVELGLPQATRWAGESVGVGPADLVHLQDVIWSTRPTAIVTTTRNRPLLRFVDAICRLAELDATPILLACEGAIDDLPERTTPVLGSPWSRETLDRLDRLVADAEEVLVLFDALDEVGAHRSRPCAPTPDS